MRLRSDLKAQRIAEGQARNEAWANTEFYQDVRASQALQDAIRALPEDAVLGCWCAPKYKCHGSVIEGVWYLLHEGKELLEWREGKLLGE